MPMLLSNPSNPAKQPLQHCESNPEQPRATDTSNPAIATTNPATIDAMTICEVIVLTNPVTIHGQSLPAFRYHLASLTRRSNPVMMHSLTRPWQFDKSALTGRIDIRKNHANGDSRILGYVWHDQNGESNAHLIAAAPDLLSAVDSCLEIMIRAIGERLPINKGTECEETDWLAAIRKARAAIAKAEGVA